VRRRWLKLSRPQPGDLNCQANSSLCLAEDTTGNSIDAAFTFWAAFAKKYAADPAVLYDTWEDMHAIDANTWSDNQNQSCSRCFRSRGPACR
jgi:hypothetical protein